MTKLFKTAKKVVKVLQKNGHDAVFAGGSVRDMLLDKTPHDFDVATSATPDVVESLFKNTKAVGKAFGVVLVRLKGVDFEVATFRSDGNYSDGRRPDTVTFSTMREDAERRDFTVNAMFFNPVTKEFVDFVDGKVDLKNKVLRFVGNADDRVKEDNLRLLRAVRFALRFDFDFDDATFEALKRNARFVLNVASERVKDELVKMLAVGKPRRMMNLLFTTNLLVHVLPEVFNLFGSPQNPKHHPEGDVLEHTVLVMEKLVGKSVELQLAGMFHDVAKPATLRFVDGQPTNRGHADLGFDMTKVLMKRLKFSTDETTLVTDLVKNHMKLHHVKEFKKSTLKKLLALPFMDELFLLGSADALSASRKVDHLTFLKDKMNEFTPDEVKPVPFVNGHDLMDLGLKPGPVFKTLLDELMELKLEDVVTNRKQALKVLKDKVDLMS